jgi:hypothetical protein
MREFDSFKLVVKLFVALLSVTDIIDISIEPSFIINGPKVELITLSLDFGNKKKKNEKISDKKYINIIKY